MKEGCKQLREAGNERDRKEMEREREREREKCIIMEEARTYPEIERQRREQT